MAGEAPTSGKMRPMRQARRFLPAFLGVSLTTASVAMFACARTARQPPPVASLARTPQAAQELTPILESWQAQKLSVPALRVFLQRHPEDPSSALVKIYLAFALLDAGDLLGADGALTSVGTLPPGSTNDLATVARARSLRLHGAPQSALESLRPSVGKIVDEADREVFLEELALSAIAAHDDYEALAYLDAWLRGVGENDRERVRGKIAELLDALPRAVLEQTYGTMRERGTASGYGAETQKLVAARLARIAVDTNDPALARWLVEVAGTSASETGGDAGLELGELAASRRGLTVIAGKTVGLLLPTRNRELRDEAADVVRGVSWALDLPRKVGSPDLERLVTRDDGEGEAGTRAAMEELTGEGASIIIAGFDRVGADRASAWSEKSGVPVLLISAPSTARMPKNVGFVLGERVEREIVMLGEALSRRGVKTAAFVADTAEDESAARGTEGRSGLVLLPPVRCDIALAEAGKTRFPVASWLASGAQGWLVSGPSGCARDVLLDIQRVRSERPHASTEKPVALTLEASIPRADVPRGVTVLSASAGLVPVSASRPEEVADEDIRSFMDRFGVRPTYWTAIGRDAGVLARAAVASLPTDTSSDEKVIAERRAKAIASVFAARVKLWTTDDKGVDKDRTLPRDLRLVTWEGAK